MPTHRVVTMEELTQYLHLPEKVVAKQLGICLTSLKKLCRQHGITRWPYRKLKSLDKKIAKAETGTGTSGEDPTTLKARAEELKKEKMAVAFTYGLKDGKDDDSVCGSDAGGSTTGEAAKTTKAKKAKPAGLVTKPAASAVLLTNPNTPTPAAVVSKGKAEWPFGKDSPGIPTPPEEPIAPQETDIFAEAVADVMADDPMVDEHAMPPELEWDTSKREDKPDPDPPDAGEEEEEEQHEDEDEQHEDEEEEEDEDEESKGATAEVKFNGTPLKGVLQKDKNGGMKMTLMLPNGLSGGLGRAGPLAGKVIVSDADMRIASALASVSSPRDPLWADSAHKDGKGDDVKDAAHGKFDLEEAPTDAPFGHDLMDAEFFSAMASHARVPEGEDTVHLGDHDDDQHHQHHSHPVPRDDESPSSMDSVPCRSAHGEGSGGDAHEKLHIVGLGADGWDEETRLWLSPDTPSKKESGTPQANAPTGAAAVILGGRVPGESPGSAKAAELDIAAMLST